MAEPKGWTLRDTIKQWSQDNAGDSWALNRPKGDYRAREIKWPEEDIAPHTSMVDAGELGVQSLEGYGDVSAATRWLTTKVAGAVEDIGSKGTFEGGAYKLLQGKTGRGLVQFGLKALDSVEGLAEGMVGLLDQFSRGNLTWDDIKSPYGLDYAYNLVSLEQEIRGMAGPTSNLLVTGEVETFMVNNPDKTEEEAWQILTGKGKDEGGVYDLKRRWVYDDPADIPDLFRNFGAAHSAPGKLVDIGNPTMGEIAAYIKELSEAGFGGSGLIKGTDGVDELRPLLAERFGAYYLEGEVLNAIGYMMGGALNVPFFTAPFKGMRSIQQTASFAQDAAQLARRTGAMENAVTAVSAVGKRAEALSQTRASVLVDNFDKLTPDEVKFVNAAVAAGEEIKFADIDSLSEFKHLDEANALSKTNAALADQMLERTMKELAEAQNLKTLTPIQERLLTMFGKSDPIIDEMYKFGDMENIPGISRIPVLRRIPSLFSLSDKSKAMMLMNTVGDVVRGGLSMKQFGAVEDVLNFFKSADSGIETLGFLGPISATATGRAVRDMLKGFAKHSEKLYGVWKGTAGERGIMTDVANALGKQNVGELIGDLAKRNGPANVMRKLEGALQLPEAGTGLARTRLLDNIVAGRLSVRALEELHEMYKGFKIPWDLDSYKAISMMNLAEHTANLGATKFGLSSQGVWTKAAEMTKAAEALIFLRLSPTYPMRNFLNNELTMLSKGVWGRWTISGKRIVQFWEDVGFTPQRLEEGIGPVDDLGKMAGEVMTAQEHGLGVLNAIDKGDLNWMDKVGNWVKQDFPGPLKHLDMARRSQGWERAASARAYTQGYIRAWRGVWRPGVAYDTMTDFAAGSGYTGPRLDDELIKSIHGSIEDVVGPDGVRKVFEDFNGYNFSSVLDDVATRLGIQKSAIYDVLPEQFVTALEQDVVAAMRTGDKATVMQVLESAHPEITKHIEDFAARAAAQEAEAVASVIEAGDVMQFYRLYARNQASASDAQFGHLSQLSHRIDGIRALPDEMQAAAWSRLLTDNETFFKGHFTRYEQRLQGLIDAAEKGGVAVPAEAIRPFRTMNKATDEFFRTRDQILKTFRDGPRGETNWLRTRGMLDTEYQKLTRVLLDEAKKLDEVLYRVVDAKSPSLSINVRAARGTINQLQERYYKRTRDIFRETENMDAIARGKRMDQFHGERLDMQNQIALAERELGSMLYEGKAYGSRMTDPEVLAIYNRNLGGGTYAQTFQDNIDELIEAGAEPEVAQRMVSAQMDAQKRMIGGRMDKYQADPTRGGNPASWWDESMVDANKALVEAESAGKDVAQFVPGAAEKISNPEVRMVWLDRLAVEMGPRSEVGTAALKQLSTEWRSTPTSVFANPATTPLRNQPYALMSAELSDLSDVDNALRMERLIVDTRNMGYDPILGQGVFDGVPEGSILVPGIREVDAVELGIRNGQESVLLSRQGLVQTGHITGGNEIVADAMRFDDIAFGDEIEDFYTTVRIGGKDVRFSIPMDEAAPQRLWTAPLEGEGDMVKMYRLQHNDMDVMDPSNSLAYNGAARTTPPLANYGKPGSTKVPRLYYYIDGTPPEARLATLPNRMDVTVPTHKIYDLADDPDGLLLAAKSLPAAEQAIKDAGYFGYRYTDGPGPNSVAIWEPLEKAGVTPSYADEAAQLSKMEGVAQPSERYIGRVPDPATAASPAYGSVYPPGNITRSGAAFKKQAMDLNLPGLHEENIDAFISITEARARTWAIQNGASPDEWYQRNLGGIYRGTREIAEEHEAVFTQRMWTTSEFKQVLKEQGLVPKQAIFNMLASEDLPKHLQDVGDFMARRRKMITDPNGPGFIGTDVARAYILSTSSIRAKAVSLSHIMDSSPTTWKRMTEGMRLDDFSYVNRAGQRLVRPEDFTALWLNTNDGRRLLAGAAIGRVDMDSMDDLLFIRDFFGAKNNLGNWLQGKKGLRRIPDLTDELNGLRLLDEAAGEMVVDISDMGKALQKLDGIGKTKDPFMRHFFGFGEMGVMDSRAIDAWLRGDGTLFQDVSQARNQLRSILNGKTPEDTKTFLGEVFGPSEKGTSSYMSRAPVYDHLETSINEAIRELKRMGLAPEIPDEMYNYMIHHWVWDKVGMAKGEGVNTAHSLYLGFAQRDASKVIRGAIDVRDGQAIIHAFGAADESTLVHEIGHLFRRELTTDPALAKQLGLMEDWVGAKAGAKWTRAQEEKFARAFEVYLKEGIAPVASLEPAFKRFKQWLTNLYAGIRGKEIDVVINDDVRRTFEDMLDFENARVKGGYDTAPGLTPGMVDEMLPQTNAPLAEGTDNLWWTQGGNMYEEMVGATSRHMDNAPLKFDDLDPQQANLVKGYQDHVQRKMPLAQAESNRWGQQLRDAALLNYGRRSNFDQMAGHAFPFGFWSWNTMWNWLTWNSGGIPMAQQYFRFKNMTDRVGRKDMPKRFEGTFKVKLPFLPDWMGDGIYVNPLGSALPFNNWMDTYDRLAGEEDNLNQGIQRYLDNAVKNGDITPDEFGEAMMNNSGEVWDEAEDAVRRQNPPDHPIDNLSYLLAPHAPFTWAWHLLRKQPEKIGPFMPLTRTIRGVSSVLGVNGGAGFNPESGLRKALKLPEGDQYDEYRIERMLSTMLADGTINLDEFRSALVDKGDHPLWIMAEQRAGQEYAVSGILGSLGIPARPFPPGEERGIALKKDMDLAYASGNSDRINKFWDEYPEAAGRWALWKKPEERAPLFLTQQLVDKYYDMSVVDRRNFRDAVGDEFWEKVINKETKLDPMDQDLNELVMWAKTMGLVTPESLKGAALPFEQVPEDIAQMTNAYYDARSMKFPDIFTVQEEFFAIEDKREQRAFKAENPQLQAYWDWRRQFMLKNPNIIPYLVEDPSTLEPRDAQERGFAEEGREAPGPILDWFEWRPVLSTTLWRLVGDEFRSGLSMGPSAFEQIERLAEQLDITPEALMSQMEQSYQDNLQEGG